MREVAVRPQARLNVLSLYGALALTIATVIHFGTYLGRPISAMHPLFWGLHAAVFPLFIAFVLRIGAWQSVRPAAFGLKRRQLRWDALSPYFPRWAAPLIALLFVYVLGNFFFSLFQMSTKAPRGSLTDAQMVYMVRAFSGHWLIFYTLPTLFFAYVPWKARPAAEQADAAL